MSVKRYDLVTRYRGHESWDEMGDAEDGTYVRHDDYAELESKLETALRECRSAGITIDNLEAKCAALAADNKKAMEAMRQADAAVKLAHEKFSALAAENAKLKKFCKGAAFDADYEAELGMERGGFSDALNEIKTPATNAFLAEVRAQGVEMAMEHMQSSGSLTFGDCYISLNEFAAQPRKGSNQ